MSANPSSQEWNAQYDAVVQAMRAGGGQAGIMTPEMARGKTGLALLQAMLAGTLPYAPIADTIDFAQKSVLNLGDSSTEANLFSISRCKRRANPSRPNCHSV